MDLLDKDALLDDFLEEQKFKKKNASKSKLGRASDSDECFDAI
jgi:hypothetical protein